MQNQSRAGSALSHAPLAPDRAAAIATNVLKRLFRRVPLRVSVRLWNGAAFTVGSGAADSGGPSYALVFRNPKTVSEAILGRDPLLLAEAYFRGDLDIEGDFFAALGIKDYLSEIQLSMVERIAAVFMALRLRALTPAVEHHVPLHGRTVKAHSKAENSAAIQFHYDVSNDFYALWLDRAMVYSCAYFEDRAVDLDEAQRAKLDLICRKLRLQSGEQFLDIGCGWGALVIHAAKHFNVRAHGVTLSPHQLQIARQRIAAEGLENQATVELMDYRDIPGNSQFDKVASVGMFEHVGLKNLPTYFAVVHRVLKPKGLFLNHGITHDDCRGEDSLSTEFINRYVFPDGELDTISNIQKSMEQARFEIADVESLRPHYALTLRRWAEKLEQNHAAALQFVNEATYRVWRLYVSACALDFEAGSIGIYQVLASKRAPGIPALPLTRRHLYG